MKKKRAAIWKRILAAALTVALLPVGGLQPAKAATTVSIQVEYRADGQSLMNLVNEYRARQTAGGTATPDAVSPDAVSLGALTYDYGLERAAMKRAAQIALVYGPTSPDGTPGLSVYSERLGVRAESRGREASASGVCGNWRDTTADYNNMMNPDFKTMGVGHAVYNGHDYWVAAFSDRESNDPAMPQDARQEIAVSAIQDQRVVTDLGSSLTLNVGETRSFANATASVRIEGHLPADEYCPILSGTPTVTSNNTSVVSVDGTTIRAVKAGEATVMISCGGVSGQVNVRVQQASLSQVTIDRIPDQSYSGYALTPTVTVRAGNTTLQLNTDYTVQYENNINLGTARVVVTGQGMYSGSSTSTTFQIVPPTVNNATVTTIPDQAYTGNPIYPAFTVYVSNRVLQQGIDYNVSYLNNTNMGTASIVITGIGVYSGTKTVTFRITGSNLMSATIDAIPDQLYTGYNLSPALTVRLNNLILNPNVDYYASYSNNRNIGTATVTITGRGNYSGMRTTTFRIIDRDLSYATVSSIPNQRYTGSEIRPGVTVTLGGSVLRENVDYTLSYQNNRQPGTASVIINGAGSYKGSKAVTFTITQTGLSSATVKVSNQTYNGSEREPDVTVRLNGDLLEEGEDYEVEYRNNVKPGKATVVISGTGYYSGTKRATFVIKPKKQTLKSAKPSGKNASLVWTKDSNVKGYEIFRSKKKSSGYKRIGTFTTNKTTACRNTSLSRGSYYYKVRSYIVVDGKKYYGAFSNVKKVTIK